MFADRLKQLRIDRDITQAELANLLRISPQAVYKYENGIVTNIPLDKIQVLADFFSVSPAYLAGWDDAPSPTDLSDSELSRRYRAAAETLSDEHLEKLTELTTLAGSLSMEQLEMAISYMKFLKTK